MKLESTQTIYYMRNKPSQVHEAAAWEAFVGGKEEVFT